MGVRKLCLMVLPRTKFIGTCGWQRLRTRYVFDALDQNAIHFPKIFPSWKAILKFHSNISLKLLNP